MNIQEQIDDITGTLDNYVSSGVTFTVEEAQALASNMQAMLKKNERLREALEGWMIDHGHRCRICTERSQTALKGQT